MFIKIFALFALPFLAPAASADADVTHGAQVVNENCGRCHNARPVQEFRTAQWGVILPHMRERAHLTGAETEAVLAFFASLQAPPTDAAMTTAVPLATGASAEPDRGRELAARYACQACHVMAGAGGTLGPSLDGVVKRKGQPFVREKIRDPQLSNPTSAMPKLPLGDADLDAVVAYLTTLD